MRIELFESNGIALAEIVSDKIEIKDAQSALDLIANCGYQGADGIVMHEENISPDFFELKTGLAGEVLQKFSNYKMKLAIVGDFSKYTSKSLTDFIYESNKGRQISFVKSLEEAKQALTK